MFKSVQLTGRTSTYYLHIHIKEWLFFCVIKRFNVKFIEPYNIKIKSYKSFNFSNMNLLKELM